MKEDTKKCNICKKQLKLSEFKNNNKGCIKCLERCNRNRKKIYMYARYKKRRMC